MIQTFSGHWPMRTIWTTILAGCLVLTDLNPALTQPLDLGHTPLDWGTKVEPNVMLVFDNSGSMSKDELVTNISINGTAPWFAKCSAYNALYFDPTQTYQPWIGKDKSA